MPATKLRALLAALLSHHHARHPAGAQRAAALARLSDAVHRLPEPERTILLLHRAQRLPIPAIAHRLELTPAEVEVRLAAALVTLAPVLDQPRRSR